MVVVERVLVDGYEPMNSQIEFLYKTEGRGTRGMAMLAPGDDFNVAGPLGHGFTLDPGWKNIVVLGRGVGLATLAPLSQLAAGWTQLPDTLENCWPDAA